VNLDEKLLASETQTHNFSVLSTTKDRLAKDTSQSKQNTGQSPSLLIASKKQHYNCIPEGMVYFCSWLFLRWPKRCTNSQIA